MSLTNQRSHLLFTRAQALMPGGVTKDDFELFQG